MPRLPVLARNIRGKAHGRSATWTEGKNFYWLGLTGHSGEGNIPPGASSSLRFPYDVSSDLGFRGNTRQT
jgi:hypothetical protein